jgi:hypothetical protein
MNPRISTVLRVVYSCFVRSNLRTIQFLNKELLNVYIFIIVILIIHIYLAITSFNLLLSAIKIMQSIIYSLLVLTQIV